MAAALLFHVDSLAEVDWLSGGQLTGWPTVIPVFVATGDWPVIGTCTDPVQTEFFQGGEDVSVWNRQG